MLSIGYYCVVSVTIGDQSVRTLIKTLIISKYFVGSGANPVHTHVVVKSLLMILFSSPTLYLRLFIRIELIYHLVQVFFDLLKRTPNFS